MRASFTFGRLARATALLLVLAPVLACESFATDPGANGDGAPAGTVGQILVRNTSSDYMSAVYYAPCGQALTENRGAISSGQSRSWTVTPGCYDVRAVSSTGSWGPSRGTVAASQTLELTYSD